MPTLYGHQVTVITDHSAVKAILQTPSANESTQGGGSKIFSSGVGKVDIVYRPGKDNGCVDALSRNPLPYDGIVIDDELQVARVRKTEELGESHSMMDLKQSSSSHGDFDPGTEEGSRLEHHLQVPGGQRATR